MQYKVDIPQECRKINAKQAEKACNTNKNSNPNPTVSSNLSYVADYLLLGPGKEADRKESAKLTKQLHNEFKDIFTGISCFEGIFTLQIKEKIKQYQDVLHMDYSNNF